MTPLSELLNSANADSLSARSIARQAQAAGFTLNHDTTARYLRGDHGRPDEPTLRAFADVLNIPLADLRRAADLPADATDPYVPPAESSRLSRRQRRAVDEIIRAMLEPAAGSSHLELVGTGPGSDSSGRPDSSDRPAAGASDPARPAQRKGPRTAQSRAADRAEAARRGSSEPPSSR